MRAIAARDRADAAWVTIGVVSTKQGRTHQAVEAFHESARLNPRNPEALRWLARHYSDRSDLINEVRFAIGAFEAAPGDEHYAAFVHHVLADKLGDYRRAYQLYHAAVAAHPDNAGLWGKLGEVQYQLGDFDAALAAHRRAATLAPSQPGHLVHQVWALLATQQLAGARESAERAVAIDPTDGEAHFALGWAYARTARLPEATLAFERAFTLNPPDNSNRLITLCGLYRQAARFDRAHSCLQAVLRLDPKNQQALRWMRDVEQNVSARSQAR